MVALSQSVKTDFSFHTEQKTALLVDDLSRFGAPFSVDVSLTDAQYANHSIGGARTLTPEIVIFNGYRYRTHLIKPILQIS